MLDSINLKIQEELTKLKNTLSGQFVVTHPARTIGFFFLVGPITFAIGIGGFVGIIGILLEPFLKLFGYDGIFFPSLNLSNPEDIFIFIAYWIFAFLIFLTMASLGTFGFLSLLAEIWDSLILCIRGKKTTGVITYIETSSKRYGNSTYITYHIKVNLFSPVMQKNVIISGYTTESFLRKIFEIELKEKKEVILIYDPKDQNRLRLKHKDI